MRKKNHIFIVRLLLFVWVHPITVLLKKCILFIYKRYIWPFADKLYLFFGNMYIFFKIQWRRKKHLIYIYFLEDTKFWNIYKYFRKYFFFSRKSRRRFFLFSKGFFISFWYSLKRLNSIIFVKFMSWLVQKYQEYHQKKRLKLKKKLLWRK